MEDEVTIKLNEEAVRQIREIQQLKYRKGLSDEFIVHRALQQYYDRKMDEEMFRKYRKLQLRRKLSYQSWLCYYCEKPLAIGNCTLDHLIPKDRGGTSDPDNLVVTCTVCNWEKGNMTEEEYRKFRATHPKGLGIFRKNEKG